MIGFRQKVALVRFNTVGSAQEKNHTGSGRETGSAEMEAAVFILSLVDCCALIFLSVYFVSFINARHE